MLPPCAGEDRPAPSPSRNPFLSPGLPLSSPVWYSTSYPLSEPQAVLCFQNPMSSFCLSSRKGPLWSPSLWSSTVEGGGPRPLQACVGSVSRVGLRVPPPSTCCAPVAGPGARRVQGRGGFCSGLALLRPGRHVLGACAAASVPHACPASLGLGAREAEPAQIAVLRQIPWDAS